MSQNVNDYLVLVSGKSASGKSASLAKIREPQTVMYINAESGKKLPFRALPFRAKFKYDVVLTNPMQLQQCFDKAESDPEIKIIIVDTLTFLLDMYVSQYVKNAADGRKAWGDFAEDFRNMMQQMVAKSTKTVIFLAHTLDHYNETTMMNDTFVPVAGSLKNQGIEAWFSLVISTKKIKVTEDLVDHSMLTITARDRAVGYKHVFQTMITKETTGERIRGPMGLFEDHETYMDNDIQMVIDRLQQYYG